MTAAIVWSVASTPGVVVAAVAATPVVDTGGAAGIIATYQRRIPELMAEQDIPGLAVALVDGDRVLWSQGFGHVDGDGSAPVDTDTIFSVQSMSKTFTATAVMRAVQAGKVALDQPITTYLPDFTVHSAFEERPERKITLRRLLSHTAGLTQEAPVGNNNELDPGDFGDHVHSISDTWLRFPVGTGYAYSNLGIDLAGHVLESVYARPFAALMRDLLLMPLGMAGSTFDRAEIRATTNRAIGHISLLPEVPLDIPMTAAGGLYASASDLARFLRFQLNEGSIDGQVVLDPSLVTEQRMVPAPHAGERAGYALGVARTGWYAARNADLFSHGGGSYGFLADLWWLPQLQLGIAILTNASDHDLQGDLALSILGDLVHEPGSIYHDRLLALPAQAPVVQRDGHWVPPEGLAQTIAELARPPSGDEATRWAAYAGGYRTVAWGLVDPVGPPGRFLVESGLPFFESVEDGVVARQRLSEIEPGLFLAGNGETLDLRRQPPTWRNFELSRVAGPAPWQWALLAASAVVSGWWLIMAFVSTIRRRGRVAEANPDGIATHRGRRLLLGIAGTLTAVLMIGAIALVAAIPGLADAGFLGWLNFPSAQRLLLHLPFGLTVAASGLAILAVTGWTKGWWPRADPLRHALLVLASLAVVSQLAGWQLIGWGFG
ncbi:MAG: beta-lactamase family protein [Chloroflexi bacterium]|nr:beta-lactamase family protein [Chloroflexota bacterium]